MTETPTEDAEVVIVATHGFTVLGKTDEAERSVTVRQGSNGSYHVLILTKWKDAAEEVRTELLLSPDGLEVLTKALHEALTNMEAYKLDSCAVKA